MGGDIGMGDDIGMDTDVVGEAARRLQTTGDTLRTQWTAAAAAIIGAEVGIGHGRLAAAFSPTYRPASSTVRAAADAIPPRFTELSTATSISVSEYSMTDAQAAQRFQALLGKPEPRDYLLHPGAGH
jgi:Excreted virulence factor EspC, type VII ESX diderm